MEGLRLFEAAWGSGWRPDHVLASPGTPLPPCRPQAVAPEVLATAMIQPRLEPVVAWGPAPRPTLPTGDRLLLLGLQDPMNLGALLRTARGLGLDGAFLLPGCPDPYNHQVLRSSAGTVFGFPIGRWEGERGDRTLFLAKAHGGKAPPITPPSRWILAMGHETGGIPSSLEGEALSLSLLGVESLGVAAAGAIIMDRLARRAHRGI